jgi:hypothetical protein
MKKNSLKNEKGVALIIALLMLLVLTFIGINSISTTTFETNISGNERVGTDAFYASEGGFQVALNQVPDNKPIIRTKMGDDSFYWSGTPQDKESPKSIKSYGDYQKAGFDSSWAFTRFQINATGESGESFGATKEIEAQVSYGPFSAGTQY